jgi:hypothetical protein
MFNWLLSEQGKVVFDLLEDSNSWSFSGTVITHKVTGLQLWISNGRFFFDIYPDSAKPCLTLIDRLILWRKYKKAKSTNAELKVKQIIMDIKKRKNDNENNTRKN